jgi:fructokinase
MKVESGRMKAEIVSLGELLVDMFPAEPGKRLQEVSAFRPVPGGAPANVAVAAARLGRSSAFIGKVGDEVFGHHLAHVLEREGVSTRGIRFDAKARTTMAFIAMPNENQAEFVFYRNPGADMLLRPDELERELLQTTRVLHFGSISLIEEPSRSATIEAVQLARSAGALISFDVNYRPSLWTTPAEARRIIEVMIPSAHLLKVNETELALLCGSEDMETGSRDLLWRGPQACVVTLGARGGYFRVAGGSGYVPGFAVRTVDATGCGDAFVAALLSRLLAAGDWRGHFGTDEMRRSVRYGNAAGALTAQKLGVIPALPTAGEVEAFLEEHTEGED